MNPRLVRFCTWVGLHRRTATPRRTPDAYRLAYEEIRFSTAHKDGVRLSGWLIPAASPRGLVILCHGYGCTRTFVLGKAAMLQKQGYTTLLFDFRARGLSEGPYCTLGQRETDDVLGAVQYAADRADLRSLPIFALGESMGGAAALQAAARDERIRAVIAEAAFASLDDAVVLRFRQVLGPLGGRMAQACMELGEQDLGLKALDVAPVRVIAQIAPRPVFLITDALDMVCLRPQSDRLYEAAGEPKQRWIVPNALHTYAFQTARAEYEQRICQFLNAALPASS